MRKAVGFRAGEDTTVDVIAAIKWLNAAVMTTVGHALREPEIVILKGTWRGLTYEQMSDSSEYSTNYLMRDVAPKLWKQLSHVFGGAVGKTNFRVALEAYVSANAESEPALATYGLVEPGFPTVLTTDFQDTASADAGLYWHPAVASDPRSAVSASTASYLLSTEGGYGDGFSIMPVPSTLYGYAEALLQARQWLSAAALGARPGANAIEGEAGASGGGHCRLVGIWGLSGVGKTLLAKTLVSQVGEQFDGVIWRSLKDRPTLNDLCSSILMGLGVMPAPSQSTVQLLSVLSQKSILLVLDGVEAILHSGCLAGEYQPGYQAYDEFFQSAAGLLGCIIVTGLEGPLSLRLQGTYRSGGEDMGSAGSLMLGQLSEPAAIALLQAESLADADRWPNLIARYQGHPLALKSAARVIRDIFEGQVAAFLAQSSLLLTDISRLLAPSFQRLSAIEVSILYWLASYDEPLPLAVLQRSLPVPVGPPELVSALDSLNQRSLLEVQLGGGAAENAVSISSHPAGASMGPGFYLSPLVKAYAVQQFMAEFSEGYLSQEGHRAADPMINLSADRPAPVQLAQWLHGQVESGWQTLDRLFSLSAHPAMRLRNVYHWRDASLIKRCKAILLAKKSTQVPIEIFLLVAVHQEGENRLAVCVQAQPTHTASRLPVALTISLLDSQQTVLACVIAQPDDTFIQLPYFRGVRSEGFEIEVILGKYHHTESFVI